MRKRLSALALFIMLLAIGAFPASAEEIKPVLSEKSLTFNIYGLTRDEGFFCPADNTVQIWNLKEDSTVSVTAPKLLKVKGSGGNYSFYPKKKGRYEVVFDVDGRKLTCKVNVVSAYFKRSKRSLSDNDSSEWIPGRTMLALRKGEKATLKVKGMPSKVRWKSSDRSVARVSSTGEVTGRGYGYATITASCRDVELTYEVGVSYDEAIGALSYAVKNYHSEYSQEKRTVKGYYDCSSYVWFSYKSQGITFGNDNYPPTAANIAYWCEKNGWMILEGKVAVSKLLPGDLIFLTGKDNGRYKGIYHVDLFQGNYSSITVARQKFYWEVIDNVMVARPSSVTAARPTVVSAPLSTCLNWRESFGAGGYIIYRSDSENGIYRKIGKAKNSTTYYDATAEYKKKYYYKVLPYWSSKKVYYGTGSKQGNGTWVKRASPGFTISNTYGGITMEWEPVAGATGYQILRSGSSGKWKKIAAVSGGKTTAYLDTSVKNNKIYRYSLIAVRDNEKSDHNEKGARLRYIAAPEITDLTSAETGMTIRWNKVSGAKCYQLYRKLPSGNLQELATTMKNTYTDTEVSDQKAYTYIVRCVSRDGKTMISGYNKKGVTGIYRLPVTADETGGQLADTVPQF